jgi:hypothetical protein
LLKFDGNRKACDQRSVLWVVCVPEFRLLPGSKALRVVIPVAKDAFVTDWPGKTLGRLIRLSIIASA